MFDFVEALKQSPLFAHVEAKRVTKGAQGQQDMTEFEIICSLGVDEPSASEDVGAG